MRGHLRWRGRGRARGERKETEMLGLAASGVEEGRMEVYGVG